MTKLNERMQHHRMASTKEQSDMSRGDMKIRKLTILSVLVISGCFQKPKYYERDFEHMTRATEVELAEAALSVNDSLTRLVNIHQSKASVTKRAFELADAGMDGYVTIQWSGPVVALLQALCNSVQYQLKFFGHEPALPILMQVSRDNAPISDLIRDALARLDCVAEVTVFPAERLIEIRYIEL